MEVCLTYLRLNKVNDSAVNVDMDSAIVVEVQLSVDVVLSSGRHRQFSVLVRETAPKIAVKRVGRPVRDHYEAKYKQAYVIWEIKWSLFKNFRKFTFNPTQYFQRLIMRSHEKFSPYKKTAEVVVHFIVVLQ